jgi:hypothetical protein
VRDSDGTVVFSIGAALTGGSKKTVQFAPKHQKPVLHLSRNGGPSAPEQELLRFIREHHIRVFNVSGRCCCPSNLWATRPGAREGNGRGCTSQTRRSLGHLANITPGIAASAGRLVASSLAPSLCASMPHVGPAPVVQFLLRARRKPPTFMSLVWQGMQELLSFWLMVLPGATCPAKWASVRVLKGGRQARPQPHGTM